MKIGDRVKLTERAAAGMKAAQVKKPGNKTPDWPNRRGTLTHVTRLGQAHVVWDGCKSPDKFPKTCVEAA